MNIILVLDSKLVYLPTSRTMKVKFIFFEALFKSRIQIASPLMIRKPQYGRKTKICCVIHSDLLR